jgi:hypothetical protein
MEEMDADQPVEAAGNMVTNSGERTERGTQRLRLQVFCEGQCQGIMKRLWQGPQHPPPAIRAALK